MIYRFSGLDEKQKSSVPSIKKDNKCFQHAVTVALHYEEIKKDPQRITQIKPFINKHNWEGINIPSDKDNWKKFRNIM